MRFPTHEKHEGVGIHLHTLRTWVSRTECAHPENPPASRLALPRPDALLANVALGIRTNSTAAPKSRGIFPGLRSLADLRALVFLSIHTLAIVSLWTGAFRH